MDQGGSKNGPHGQNGPNGENEHGPNGPTLDPKYKTRPKKMKFPKFNLAKANLEDNKLWLDYAESYGLKRDIPAARKHYLDKVRPFLRYRINEIEYHIALLVNKIEYIEELKPILKSQIRYLRSYYNQLLKAKLHRKPALQKRLRSAHDELSADYTILGTIKEELEHLYSRHEDALQILKKGISPMREAKIQITGFVQQTNLLLQNTRHAIHEAFRDFKAINLKIKCIHERIAADSEFVPNEKRAKRFQQPDESMMTREERPGVTITQKKPFFNSQKLQRAFPDDPSDTSFVPMEEILAADDQYHEEGGRADEFSVSDLDDEVFLDSFTDRAQEEEKWRSHAYDMGVEPERAERHFFRVIRPKMIREMRQLKPIIIKMNKLLDYYSDAEDWIVERIEAIKREMDRNPRRRNECVRQIQRKYYPMLDRICTKREQQEEQSLDECFDKYLRFEMAIDNNDPSYYKDEDELFFDEAGKPGPCVAKLKAFAKMLEDNHHIIDRVHKSYMKEW